MCTEFAFEMLGVVDFRNIQNSVSRRKYEYQRRDDYSCDNEILSMSELINLLKMDNNYLENMELLRHHKTIFQF